MTWITPKTNWNTSDGIGYADLNRIESNILNVRNATVRKVQGFGYLIYNNVSGYDGIVAIQSGSCYSSDGFPIYQTTEFRKNLNTWVLGSGNDKGGMASAVTPASETWYYIYAILNSSTGAIDFMFDDDPDGVNIPAGTFNKKRYIGAFKTAAAGAESSFYIHEMYAIGDNTFINPSDMYTGRELHFDQFSTPTLNNNAYCLAVLNEASKGFALPARLVRARLNAYTDADDAIGFISNYGGFTVPANLYSVSEYTAEVLSNLHSGGSNFNGVLDFDIMVNIDRKLNIAYRDTSANKAIWIAIRGFHDERLI